MVKWKTIAGECPNCQSYAPKIILLHCYLRKTYTTIWTVQCQRCKHIFTFDHNRSELAELRHRYGLSRHEQSVIFREAVKGAITYMAEENKEPPKSIWDDAREQMENGAKVTKLLRDIH